jgi:hypothetical protein
MNEARPEKCHAAIATLATLATLVDKVCVETADISHALVIRSVICEAPAGRDGTCPALLAAMNRLPFDERHFIRTRQERKSAITLAHEHLATAAELVTA